MISKRKRKNILIKFSIIFILVAIAVTFLEMTLRKEPLEVEVNQPERLLEVKSKTSRPSQILDKKGFKISYNEKLKIPNWVAWKLTAEMTQGTLKRSNNFAPDPDAPASSQPTDYKNSGYDRGHMAPSGDMKWNPEAMTQCFYMTNIAPQKQVLNGGPWNKLEERCRTWACRYKTIYIICGPVPTDRPVEYIGQSKVAVPKRFFKVILAPDTKYGPMGIGFVMNNGQNKDGMRHTALSIDEVEAITGYDFFSALPDSVENEVEKMNNLLLWDSK